MRLVGIEYRCPTGCDDLPCGSAPRSADGFLNGVTRQRVAALLRGDGVEVRETTLTYADVLDADEIFSTGNYSKIMPLTRIDDRSLRIGPVARKAHELYFDYARNFSVF